MQEDVLAKLKETHPERTYEEVGLWSTGLEHRTFGGGVYFPYKANFTFVKKNGHTSIQKSHTVNVYPSFCPFCGKSLNEESEVENG